MRTSRWSRLLIAGGMLSFSATQFAFDAFPAHAASAAVQPGTATASAALLGDAPVVSGLALTSSFGESTAAYEESEAQASSASANLGGLGSLLANTQFCGNTDLPASEQPQPLTADSENGAANNTNSLPGVGEEAVSVDPSPEEAQATTSPLAQSIAGILTVTGDSDASVQYVAGSEQEADSAVKENVSLLGGLVQLSGMSWQASYHSGSTNASSAAFSFGQLSISGVPVGAPNTPIASQLSAINNVIGIFGFTLTAPASSGSQSSGNVSIGPLALRFSGSQVENTIASPLQSPVTNLESELASAAQAGSDCTQLPQLIYNLGTNLDSYINLALDIAQGAGALEFDFGGASAGIAAAPDYTNPFDTGGSGGSGGTAPPPTTLGSNPLDTTPGTVVGTAGLGSGSSTSATGPSLSGTSASTSPANQSSSASPPTTTRSSPGTTTLAGVVVCRTQSPANSPGCWRGVASLAAGAVVVAGSGLFFADYWYGHRRRSRRRRRRYADV